MDNERDVALIRSFNRFYTSFLGILNQHILDSDFSMTEARILFEIYKTDNCTSNDLGDRLKIDPSYMSRIIKGFQAEQLITKTVSQEDNRFNVITLTSKGRSAIEELNTKSDIQLMEIISNLSQKELDSVLDSMNLIRTTFSSAVFPASISDYSEDDLEYIIKRHEEIYREEYNLSPLFAKYVELGVHNLAEHLDTAKECILIPKLEGRRLGCIAVSKSEEKTAQLRYFLLEPEARGHGLGNRMVDMALEFCRKAGYDHIFLETISILTTARKIYKSKGFQITHTQANNEWGSNLLEERWDMDL